jgi:hypothetical protein
MLFDSAGGFDKPPQIYSTEKAKFYIEMMMTTHWNTLKSSMIKHPG